MMNRGRWIIRHAGGDGENIFKPAVRHIPLE
jgi:hypothetical protein